MKEIYNLDIKNSEIALLKKEQWDKKLLDIKLELIDELMIPIYEFLDCFNEYMIEKHGHVLYNKEYIKNHPYLPIKKIKLQFTTLLSLEIGVNNDFELFFQFEAGNDIYKFNNVIDIYSFLKDSVALGRINTKNYKHLIRNK